MADYREKHRPISADSFKVKVDQFRLNDSIDLKNISMLTSKVFVSISNDSLDIKEVDSILKGELQRKGIDLKSKLTFYESLMESVGSQKVVTLSALQLNQILNMI